MWEDPTRPFINGDKMKYPVQVDGDIAYIADSTVAMNFEDYAGAEAFCEWWDEQGEFNFVEWAKK